jgi:hypothetical protein
MNPDMTVRGTATKLMKALLALSLIFASAPILQASAAPVPCDCPSMQMHGQDMDHQTAPAKQQSVPCNEMPNCLCGAVCGTAAALPQNSYAAVATAASEKISWPDLAGASGHSIKPAIPPPIISV